MRRLVPLLALTASAACSLLVPLDDLGPSSDASPETGGQDVAQDAGLDAADAQKDAAPFESGPGCDAMSPTPTFCEDFDEPVAKQPTDLGVPNVNPGDQIVIDGTDFFSAPRSFVATMPFSTTNQGLANVTMNVASSPPSVIEVAFEAKIDDSSTIASGCAIYQPTATGLTLVITPTGLWVQEGPFSSGQTYNDHTPHSVNWSAGWVKLDVKLDKVKLNETLTIDGVVAETQPLDARFVFSGQMQYTLGFTYAPAGSGLISARIDNLAMWVTP